MEDIKMAGLECDRRARRDPERWASDHDPERPGGL